MKKTLTLVGPWIIAAIIFYFLFQRMPARETWDVMKLANPWAFIGYTLLYFLAMLFLDALSLKRVISRFSTHVDYKETLLFRGATYLLMLLNYNLAQGGIALYLKKTHKAPVFKTLGAVFYLSLIDLLLVLSYSVVSVFFVDNVSYRGIELKPLVIKLAIVFYSSFILWMTLWRATLNPRVLARMQKIKLLHWIIEKPLFFAFREANLKDFFQTVLLRLPVSLVILVGTSLMILAFHGWIPLGVIFLYSPIVMVIGALPITPAGLGTSQLLCVEFFKDSLFIQPGYELANSPEHIIFAATLLWAFANLTLKMIFGLFCLHTKSKSLFIEK